MRLALLFILLCFTAGLVSCDDADSSSRSLYDSKYDSKNLEETAGTFVRIKASYELIETGEPLDFDFIVSCYNADVPGSFNGILKPTNMFKATSTGAAVAISPPQHYCERGLRGFPLEKENDVIKMPVLMWYPDVNDLSFVIFYMTNDAYTGPNAKVRFKSYSFAKTDRKSFLSWEAKTLAAYKQLGAIPGPFGCATENAPLSDPFSCGYEDTIARNNGHFLAIETEDLFNKYYFRIKWPEDVAKAFKDYLDVDHPYYCIGSTSSQSGKRYIRNLAYGEVKGPPGKMPEHLDSYDKYRKHVLSPEDMLREVYLDPKLLLTGKGTRTVIEVYPWVAHRHPFDDSYRFSLNKFSVYQVLETNKWRGFGISNMRPPITNYLPEITPLTYAGSYRSALFLNNELICESKLPGSPFEFYDLKRGHLARTR